MFLLSREGGMRNDLTIGFACSKGVNYGRLLQAVATKDRCADVSDGVWVNGPLDQKQQGLLFHPTFGTTVRSRAEWHLNLRDSEIPLQLGHILL
jgi:hypothetical protein